jgi:large subunit ribosomal protein L15
MSISLNNLAKIKRNDRIRVGRGIGSGKGKTSGRGVKGQKARTGSTIKGFEGGQTPVHMRLPKRGFVNVLRNEYETINISDVIKLVEKQKFDTSAAVSKEKLQEFGLIKSKDSKVKLIMGKDNAVKVNFKVAVDTYSAKAKAFSS